MTWATKRKSTLVFGLALSNFPMFVPNLRIFPGAVSKYHVTAPVFHHFRVTHLGPPLLPIFLISRTDQQINTSHTRAYSNRQLYRSRMFGCSYTRIQHAVLIT